MQDKKKPAEYPCKKGYQNMIGLVGSDPLGSYTGRPAGIDEQPVQDADGL